MNFSDIDFWRSATLTLAAIGQTLFIFMYATLPWWNSYLGRALFLKSLVLAVFLDVAALARVLDLSHRSVVFVVVYAIMAVAIWGQVIAYLRLTNMRKDPHRE